MQDMNDILNGVEPTQPEEETPQVTAEENTETEEVVEAKQEEATEDTEKGVKEERESPSQLTDEVRGLLSATKAERERRQQAEARLEELQKQMEEKEPLPSVFEDEQKFVDSMRQEVNQQILNERLNVSEAYAREKFGSEDVDQAFAEFQALAQSSPEVANRVMSASLPWVEMVQAVNQHREFEAMKDVDGYKAKLRAEVEAEIRKELEAKQQAADKLRSSVPTSLVDAPSKGSLKGSDWSGPASIDSILSS